MIEEELAPVYTNAPEETPSPELPQKPIAGGVEKDFNELIVGGMSNMLQDEQEQNVRQNQINVEDKRKKLNAIRGGMMEREDHSEQEKSIAVQNWITESTGKLPKNHVEMRFAMDKLWKRAGKDGLAPSYEAVFDVVKERFREDKMQADEEEGYFKAGAKSMFSPKMYSWEQTIKQQDIDPKRMKILKAMYDEGAKAQKDRYPQDMVAKINLAMEAANSIKTDEVTAGGKRQADWTKKSEDAEPSYGDIIEDLTAYTKGMNQKDKSLFVAGLRESIQSDPAKNKKASDFFSQFGLNASRSVGRFSETTAGGLDFFKNLFHEANVNASELYAPFLPYGEMAHSYFEQVYKDELHETDMKKQLSDMFLNEYDPIQPFARQDTVLNWIEEGVFYQTPQVLASVGVPLLATVLTGGSGGLIAAAGSAGSLGWIGGISGSEISESQRQGYLDSGVSFDEASQRARDPLAKAWTIPHVAMGLLKVNTFARKIPLFDKALSKMDGTIRSKGLRLAAKTGLLGTAETAEEWGQDIWTEFLKEVSHQIDGEMDSPEWFGEGAFFDDFWAKSVVTFSSMGGLSMASAAGALSMEDRAAAWAELPPLVRQAAGHQQKDIDALTEADNPRDQVRAYIDSEKNKDGQSPQVTEAIKGLEEAALLQAQEIQDAQSKGLFPRSEVELLDGKPNIKVFDPETNDIILETDSFVDATTVSFDWWGKKEEDFKDEFIYVKSMFQAATMLSEQAPELVQRLSIGEQMTDTKFRETGAEAARSIAEEVKRNEMINGGDGSMANLIFGTNQVQREAGQTKIINGLFAGATVETLLHEAGHGFFKKGISDGTIDMDDAIKLLKRVDKAFQGRFTKAIKFEGKERPVESMRLLPDVDNPTFQMVDEGLMQLYSAVILGEGKLAPYRKLINDSMSAYAKSNSKSKIGNFISAMRYYFNLALSRAVAIKGMVRRGEIDQKDLDKVRAWMQGTSLQEEITGEAKKEFDATMRDGVEGTSYSTSPAFYSKMEDVLDKKIQGKQATPEQIKSIIDPSKGSGVKAEEIKWTGVIQKIDQLAADNNGKVPKAELMDWLKNDAAVEFEEKVLTEVNEYTIQQDLEDVLVEYNLYSDTGMDGEILFYRNEDSDGDRPLDYDELPSEVVEVAEAYNQMTAGDTTGASFAEYQLPNGENYKETVLTMPPREKPESVMDNWTLQQAKDYLASQMELEGFTIEYQNTTGEKYTNLNVWNLDKDQRGTLEELSPRVQELWAEFEIKNDSLVGYLDTKPSEGYISSHFPKIPNYVAHMRTNEREDSTGDEGLFIEEIQSDLHQAARKQGYKGESTEKNNWSAKLDENDIWDVTDGSDWEMSVIAKSEKEAVDKAWEQTHEQEIPDAPFRKDWHLQMFKRGLRDAIAADKDWIGWTVGQTQNERYDLSKQVKEVVVPMINKDGSRSVRVEVKENRSAIRMMVDKNAIVTGQYSNATQFNGKRLDEVLGKDVAEKIMNLTKPTTLTGNDLAVGGSGMKGFYDNMLPTAVQKYVKQWGAKVEDGKLDVRGFDPTEETEFVIRDQNGNEAAGITSMNRAPSRIAQLDRDRPQDAPHSVEPRSAVKDVPIHKVKITDAMRESIEEIGQTSFSSTPKPLPDRSGDGQGEPLTETEIRKGIEDESGTVVEPEIDDDEFLNAPEITTDTSFSIASKVPVISRESLAGKRKFAYMSDRTRVGVYEGLHPESKIRIDLQGGWKYPYIVGHKKSGAAWAFTDLGMATRFINRINKTDGIGLTTLYAKGNLVANHTFLKAYMEEAAWSIKSGDITEERFLEVANQMRESANKSKKGGKPFIPLDTEAGKLFSKEWTKLSHMEKALDSASFEVRSNKFFAYNEKKAGENKGAKIGSDSLVAEGFPSVSKMVDLFADPDLEGLPRGTVVGAIQFEKNQSGGVSAKDIGAEEHISYPVVVTGEPLGAFDKPIYILDVIKTDKKVNQALRSVEVKMADVSFSQGWQPEIRKSILTNVEKRMSTPQMKAEVIGDIQRRVQKLISDMRSFEKGMIAGDKTAKGESKRIRSMIVTYEAILMALPTNIRGKMGSIVTIADLNSEKKILEFFDKKLNRLEKVVDRWVKGKFDKSAKVLMKRALAKPKAGEKDKGKLVGAMGAALNRNFTAANEAMSLTEAEVDGKVAEIETRINSELQAGTLTSELESELESKKNLVQLFGNWNNITNADREAALKNGWREFEYAYLMSNIEKARRREELAAKADELVKSTGISIEDIDEEADKRLKGYSKFLGRVKAAAYNFYDFEQMMASVFPDTQQVVDKVVQEQQADAQFHDRMKEHQDGVENFFASLVGESFLGIKALKLQDKMQSIFFVVDGGGIKRELTQMQMIQARLMWRQEDGRRHMENWAKEEGQTNYSQEFMDAVDAQMTPEAKSLENYLSSQYEKEYDRLNMVHERMYGASLPKSLFYAPLTVSPLQSISDTAMADPLSGQDISAMGAYNPSLLRRSKTAAAKPEFRDALSTFYAHKNQIEYWMAYAEFVKEMKSLIGNRDIQSAVKAKGGTEAESMLKKWVKVLDAGGLKSSALSSQLNSFIGRSVNRTSSAILAGRLSTLAIQSTQMGAALAQMPTKDYVWRMGKLLSGNLEFAEAFNSDFIQRRLREAPPAVKMAMQGMASGSPSVAKAAAQKLGTLISGADAFFTSGTYAIILDYLTTKKGMSSAEAHTEATRLTEQVAQPTRMARRSMVELQQSQIALSKLSWAFASETRQKIALSAYRFATKKSSAERVRAIAVTFGFGGVFAQLVRSVGADLRDDDDDEIFDEKYWNPSRMALKAMLDPLTGVPVYGDLLQTAIMSAAKVAGIDTGYIFNNDSMISSVKDFPKATFNLYGTTKDVLSGDEETEKLLKDVDKILISIAPLNDTAAAASSFSHLVRDLFMIGKNTID